MPLFETRTHSLEQQMALQGLMNDCIKQDKWGIGFPGQRTSKSVAYYIL